MFDTIHNPEPVTPAHKPAPVVAAAKREVAFRQTCVPENKTKYLAHLYTAIEQIRQTRHQTFNTPELAARVKESWLDELVWQLHDLKYRTFALKNIPVEARRAYAAGRDILETIAPQEMDSIRAYRPRKAFREIVAESICNPLSLIPLTASDRNKLGRAIGDTVQRAGTDNPDDFILNSNQWNVLVMVAQRIDAPSIDLHRKAVPWLTENCFHPDREETDQNLCERLIAEIRQVYKIASPSTIVLQRNDTGVAYGVQGYHTEEKRHYSTFVNMHRLDRAQKFLQIMHECAAHMFRDEFLFNPNYKIPPFNPACVYTGQASKTDIRFVEQIVEPSSQQIYGANTTNYSQAIAAFGDKIGRDMYHADYREREAALVENLARASMMKIMVSKHSPRYADIPIRLASSNLLWLMKKEIEESIKRELNPPQTTDFDYAPHIDMLVGPHSALASLAL